MFVSQPLDTSASQSAKSEVHSSEHAPKAHVGVAFTVLHEMAQPPQFDTSSAVAISHPFEARPSQSPNP